MAREFTAAACTARGNAACGWLTVALASLLWAPLALFPAAAASFDCVKAGTTVEKTICGDAELSKLDEVLGEAYARARTRAADPKALKSEQFTWLRHSRDSCADAACLKTAYEARIAELAKIVGAKEDEIVRRDKYGNPYDAQGLPVGPAEATSWGQAAYSGFKIMMVSNRGEELCEGLARGLRQHDLVPRAICGVPLPANEPDFEQVPPWRDLDPAANMELVKELYFWSNVRSNVFSEEDSGRQRSSKSIIPELFDRIWPYSKERVKALIAAGRVKLQTSRFDYDNDGEDETVYRMTQLISQGLGEPPLFAGRQCTVAVPGWSDIPMQYMLENGGKRRNGGSFYSLFRYKGQTHIFDHSVGGTGRKDSLGTERKCLFQTISKE